MCDGISKYKNWNNCNCPKFSIEFYWKLYIAKRKRKICMCVCICVMEQKIKMQKLEKGNNSIGIIIIFSNFVPLEIVYCKKKKKNMYVCVCVMEQKIIENKNAKVGKENNSKIVLNPVPVGNYISQEEKKNVSVEIENQNIGKRE